MTITVTYNNDGTNDTKKYEHTGGKWHDVTGVSDIELPGTPDDVTITWGDTSNSATDGVIRLDDQNNWVLQPPTAERQHLLKLHQQ